jgi:type IV secretory pathway VirB2 component (pilin)
MDAHAKTKTTPPARLHGVIVCSFIALSAYLLLISPALAIATPMGAVLCSIVYMVYGNLGRGLATLAIIVVGVGATLGKTSWGLAITVGVGIAVIFKASEILGLLTGGVIVGC